MRSQRCRALVLILPAMLLLVGSSTARSDEEDAASPAKAKAPRTEEVSRDRFVETLELSGTFIPRGAQAIAYEPEVFGGTLEVVDAVKAGPEFELRSEHSLGNVCLATPAIAGGFLIVRTKDEVVAIGK